jgi:FkbM family methyltransferase
MKIFNKEISIFDFLPYFFLRLFRQYIAKKPKWLDWQSSGVPVLLYFNPILNSSSQFGEDVILSYIFKELPRTGNFIDVGANHPINLNNTYLFYQQGWRGVNIEPGEKMYMELKKYRPEDINLRIGLGNTKGEAIFYEMDIDSVSTFNHLEAKNSQYNKKIISQNKIQILRLQDIAIEYFSNKTCDLLSIDVEGSNYEVLEGNDWSNFRPAYIIIEMPTDERVKIIPYLYIQGYFLVFDNSLNGIFKDSGYSGPHAFPENFDQCLKPHLN